MRQHGVGGRKETVGQPGQGPNPSSVTYQLCYSGKVSSSSVSPIEGRSHLLHRRVKSLQKFQAEQLAHSECSIKNSGL